MVGIFAGCPINTSSPSLCSMPDSILISHLGMRRMPFNHAVGQILTPQPPTGIQKSIVTKAETSAMRMLVEGKSAPVGVHVVLSKKI